MNQSQLGIGLDTKYQGVGVGIALGNGHIDMDMLYQDVTTFRACIEHYHFKPGTTNSMSVTKHLVSLGKAQNGHRGYTE